MPVELSNVISLPDVLLTDHFDLNIAAPPGGADGQSLLIRNMTASLPGRSNSIIGVTLHRHKVNYAGRRTYPGSFQASFVDSSDTLVLDGLRAWQDQITDQATGLPAPKSNYATTATVTIYNANNMAVEQRTYYGLWISAISDISLTGGEGSGSSVQVSVTFTYDYWLPKDGSIG